MKYNTTFSKHIAYSFRKHCISYDQIKEVIKLQYMFSNGFYENNHKSKGTWQGYNDILFFDFDMSVKIENIQKMLKDFKYLIHTTKSHNKEKNGIICDRFRLIFFLENKVELDVNQYEFLMKYLCDLMGADISGARCSQGFWGYENCLFFENEGKLLNIGNIWAEIEDKFIESQKTREKKEYKDNDHNWHIMFKPELIQKGNRNNEFARICLWCKDLGYDEFKQREVLEWLRVETGASDIADKELFSIVKI